MVDQETESTEIDFDKFFEQINKIAAESSPVLKWLLTKQMNLTPLRKANSKQAIKSQTHPGVQDDAGKKADLSEISIELSLFKSYMCINVQLIIITFCQARYIVLP